MAVVRIKDIAEKANVSTGTVDRVLHNRGRVSEAVKEKVLRIAKELNYEPNIFARALVSNKTYNIAALIPSPSKDSYWQGPKTGIEKAEKELRQFGMRVTKLIFDPYSAASFRKEADKIIERKYDGVLIAPIFYRESLSYFAKWKMLSIPFILFNTHIADYQPLSYIGQDSYQSGFLAGKLIHLGQPEPATFLILHIDEDVLNSSHLVRKEQGFVDYFSQNTASASFIVEQADLQNCSDKIVCTQQLDRLLLKYPQTKGIFVTNSKASIVADYLEQKQIDHIRLVGYDLLEKNLTFLNKGTITFLINQNPEGQGFYGIHAFADHLLFKKDINSIKYLPLDIITKENLHYYIEGNK